jgi:hypothetical protein
LWRDSWRVATEQMIAQKYGLTPTSLVWHGEPWKLAEDRRLLRLVTKHAELSGLKLWALIAHKLNRTTCAVQARHHALLAGQRFARKR